MSHETSPSTHRPYGIARVTRVWQVPRSTVYAQRNRPQAWMQPENWEFETHRNICRCNWCCKQYCAWVGQHLFFLQRRSANARYR